MSLMTCNASSFLVCTLYEIINIHGRHILPDVYTAALCNRVQLCHSCGNIENAKLLNRLILVAVEMSLDFHISFSIAAIWLVPSLASPVQTFDLQNMKVAIITDGSTNSRSTLIHVISLKLTIL